MSPINFLIIGPDNENTWDLVNEIKKRKHSVLSLPIKEIFFEFSNKKFKAFWKNKDLDLFDIILFRGYNESFIEAGVLAKKFLDDKKTVVDEVIGKGFIPGKTFEASRLIKNKLRHPKTLQCINSSICTSVLKKISFPIIVKPVHGQKGKDMHKFKNIKEAEVFLKKNPTGYLIQEYCKIDGDIRVFVVGNKVLGAIKRFVIDGDFRSNASLGAKAKKYPVDKELRRLSVSAAKIMKYEIAGVDIIKYEGKYFILEVNFAPQWQKFKEITGINPAKDIINYAIRKYEKNKGRFF